MNRGISASDEPCQHRIVFGEARSIPREEADRRHHGMIWVSAWRIGSAEMRTRPVRIRAEIKNQADRKNAGIESGISWARREAVALRFGRD